MRYNSWRESDVIPCMCVLALTQQQSRILFSHKMLILCSKYSGNRIHRREMEHLFLQRLLLDSLAELFYISYFISHLAERKCFGYKTLRFSQLLVCFWMRQLSGQVHVGQARRSKALKCVEIFNIPVTIYLSTDCFKFQFLEG